METDPLAPFHPIVRDWFTETLGEPSAPQRAGWPAIASGADTLILAPTGTGKTLATFLWELSALITEGLHAPLANAVHLLYVSPLKALNNDIERNLELPLAQLKARFEQQRIGLSATQKPLDEVARFLSGCTPPRHNGGPNFRPVTIVDCGLVKRMETSVVSPVDDLKREDGTIWTSVAPLVLAKIKSARTTLVFVNNRGQAERMAARINALAEEEIALPISCGRVAMGAGPAGCRVSASGDRFALLAGV